MKIVFKWLLRLGIVLLFLTAVLWITAKIAEQKVVEQAITAMNRTIDVPVYIASIEFSLLKEFPNATLKLKDVTLLPAKAFNPGGFKNIQTDTLLWIQEVYLALNIPALLKHQISLSKITVKNGFVNLLVDEKGRSSYAVFKALTSAKADTANKAFYFKLNQIDINNLQVNYQNRFKNTLAYWNIPNYQLKGAFYKKSYAVSTQGKILLQAFQLNQHILHLETPATLETKLQIDDKTINLQRSFLRINGQQIVFEGTIATNPALNLNIRASGSQINLARLKNLFAEPAKNPYDMDGLFAFKALVNGPLNETKSPQMAINFVLANASFKNKFVQLSHGIQLEGSFSNGTLQNAKTSVLKLNKLAITHKSSTIHAKIEARNFLEPELRVQAALEANLADFTTYIKLKNWDKLQGNLSGNFRTQGTLKVNQGDLWGALLSMQHTGGFTLENMGFENKKLHFALQHALLEIQNQGLSLEQIQGAIQGTAVSGSIQAPRFLNVLQNKNQLMTFKANLSCGAIHYADFEPLFQSNNADTSNADFWPLKLDADLQASSFTYQNITANHVKTHLNYQNSRIELHDLSFQALDGSAQAQVVYLFGVEPEATLRIDGNLTGVDINQLFTTFNNFEQNTLTDKNIQGKLTSNFQFEASFINQTLRAESIEYLGHVRIENGKLIHFKPISEVSKFAEIEELKAISFSTLENDLLISQSNIYIPKMEISSNAFDLSIAGQQNFNGDYTYHLQVYLSDFLTGKSRHLQKQQSEFGAIEDDGLGRTRLFLLAESKQGKSSVSVDKAAVKQNLKKGLHDEKRELKKIFQEEFGWFKKDSTLKKEPEKKQKPAFTIEWDEE